MASDWQEATNQTETVFKNSGVYFLIGWALGQNE